ncbi:MAG: MFS transporter [Simkania negevensis]|nr:MFS transporter [Simkania negevensis]
MSLLSFKKKLLFSLQSALYRWGILKKDTFSTRYALHFLNIAQFLGVINDNVFKFLVVFLFIDLQGAEHSSQILFWAGTVYVLPFLLFSAAAGVIADRFSKQRVVLTLKFFELLIMLLGILAFTFKNAFSCYLLLFFLATHSTIFGPAKYGMIPELVDKDKITKANGLITSSTYLAIIIGTTLASFLTEVTNRNFPLSGAVCTAFALIGFISAVLISKTPAKGATRKINLLFIYEIYRNLRLSTEIPHLLPVVFGSASFLFIGAYFQLNVIPFAMQSLGLSSMQGGYLFSLTAVGIALGAFLAGRLCKHRLELGLSCIGGILLSITLLCISLFDTYLPFIMIALFFLGIFGGIYVVPFDSFVQTYAPDKRRGQTIAASNFLSFCGVLLAPILIAIFGMFNFTAAEGFRITSVMIFLFIITITTFLSPFFFNYLAHLFFKLFYKIELINASFNIGSPFLLIGKEIRFFHLCLLSSKHPAIHFYLPTVKKNISHFLLSLFSSIEYLQTEDSIESALKAFKEKKEKDHVELPILVLSSPSYIERRKEIEQKSKSLGKVGIYTMDVEKKQKGTIFLIFT